MKIFAHSENTNQVAVFAVRMGIKRRIGQVAAFNDAELKLFDSDLDVGSLQLFIQELGGQGYLLQPMMLMTDRDVRLEISSKLKLSWIGQD